MGRPTDELTRNLPSLPARLCAQPGQPLSAVLSALRPVAASLIRREGRREAPSKGPAPGPSSQRGVAQPLGYPASLVGLEPARGSATARLGIARRAAPGSH